MPDTPDADPGALLAAARTPSCGRRRRHLCAALDGLLCAGLAATIVVPPMPRLVWNASASAPLGLYRVVPARSLARGDMVIARTPAPARAIAAARGYVPANVPLVKRIVAIGGDRLCADGRRLFVDGRMVATRLARDGGGRPLPWWRGCRTLTADTVLLMMTERQDSFDGRYFGPSPASDIVGKATLLWAR